MPSKSSIFLLALAATAPYLYDRYQAFSGLFANRQSAFQAVNHFKGHEILFRDQIRNCEDVVLDRERGAAFLSCDPGRDLWNSVLGPLIQPQSTPNNLAGLYLYPYASPTASLHALTFRNFNPSGFHPLGIEWDPSTMMLYVTNHAATGPSIEIFHVDPDSAIATHFQTFTHPLLHAPNAIQSIRNGRLYVTNDHYFTVGKWGLLSKIESWLAFPLATVVFVDVNVHGYGPQSAKVVARLPFANGIVLLNETMLAAASSSKPGVYLYSVNATSHELVKRGFVRTPVPVDNLSEDGEGKLVLAGHPYFPAVAEVAKGRRECVVGGTEEQRRKCGCGAPSWVAEWSQEGGLRELYKAWKGEGDEGFCSSSTAVRDGKRGVGIVSGLYERGVMVFRE